MERKAELTQPCILVPNARAPQHESSRFLCLASTSRAIPALGEAQIHQSRPIGLVEVLMLQ